MTILVTGATGLVGERLLPRLVQAGIECRALVRPGKAAPAGVAAVHGDLFDPASLKQAVEDVSAVIHLAAVFRTQDTDLVWKSNVEGTRNLIDAVLTHKPDARFIMASTGLVYNEDAPAPGREDDVTEPTLDYPASKVVAETAVRDSGLTWAILRFPFVYGDGDGHLEALPGHARQRHFHPAQKMSLVHHRDIAAALELALTGAMDGRIVNIADEAPTSMYELAALVGDPLEPSSEPLKNPWYIHMDASRARGLGFQPSVRTVYQAAQEGLL